MRRTPVLDLDMGEHLPESGDVTHSQANSQTRTKWWLQLLFAALPICAYFAWWPLHKRNFILSNYFEGGHVFTGQDTFDWAQIQPRSSLHYVPCFGRFQCARLEVPLNWNSKDEDFSPRAAIAVVKLPAKVPVTDARYGGAILMNPGGPGESGVYQVLSGGRSVQTIVDSLDAISFDHNLNASRPSKHFDIIGFDSRGVNNTTPKLSCFPNPFVQQTWDMETRAEGLLGSSDTILDLAWARSIAMGESCSRDDTTRYVNTVQVVEDMVDIIEKHGKWRQQEGMKILRNKDCKAVEDTEAVMERIRWQKNDEKLLYWGFSYGTILGATFATLHPHRVRRMILDGVVDPADYYGTRWARNLLDTDKIMSRFCEYCYEAGPLKCPLYAGTSSEDVESHLRELVESVKASPLPVQSSETRGPEIITHSDIMSTIREALYEPYKATESLFEMLSEVAHHNGSKLADLKQSRWAPVAVGLHCQSPLSEGCVPAIYNPEDGATRAILCTDGHKIENMTKLEYKRYMKDLRSQSRWLGDGWAQIRLTCVGWVNRPAWTFHGPVRGDTLHPILLIGNSLDPVTPLRNAHALAPYFPGSVVLQHGAEGHCSYSSPSLCTAKMVGRYFREGVLPEPGITCHPETRPFLGCTDKEANGSCRLPPSNEMGLMDAIKELAAVWP